jgi:hypothetical protein
LPLAVKIAPARDRLEFLNADFPKGEPQPMKGSATMATQPMTNKNNRQSNSGGSTMQREQDAQRGRSTQNHADDAQGYLERGNEQLRGMVADHEGQTVLVALALGFGIGVALGYAMAGPSQHESSRWIDRKTAEELGRKLMHKMDQYLPEAVTSRMHR